MITTTTRRRIRTTFLSLLVFALAFVPLLNTGVASADEGNSLGAGPVLGGSYNAQEQQFDLNWTAVSGATIYKLEVLRDDGQSWNSSLYDKNADYIDGWLDSRSVSIAGQGVGSPLQLVDFTFGQTYTFRVWGLSPSGGANSPTSEYSNSLALAFGVEGEEPEVSVNASAPRQVYATYQAPYGEYDAYISTSWQAPASTGATPITGYEVAVRKTGTTTWYVQFPVSEPRMTFSSYRTEGYTYKELVPGESYDFRFAAINEGAGTSPNTVIKTVLFGEKIAEGTVEEYAGDNPYNAATVHSGLIGVLTGNRGLVTVSEGGTLKGTGSASILTVDLGGFVAPGNSPGNLTVRQQLNLNGAYSVEIQNAETYDQLIVGETYVSGGSAVTLGPDSTLNTYLFEGWSIAKDDSFTIIDNRHDSPVSGIFKDLPEGAQFEINGITFSITYEGGDGNDVVLTALNEGSDTVPGTPNTGVAQFVKANPLMVAGLGIIAAGILVVAAIRRRTTQ